MNTTSHTSADVSTPITAICRIAITLMLYFAAFRTNNEILGAIYLVAALFYGRDI